MFKMLRSDPPIDTGRREAERFPKQKQPRIYEVLPRRLLIRLFFIFRNLNTGHGRDTLGATLFAKMFFFRNTSKARVSTRAFGTPRLLRSYDNNYIYTLCAKPYAIDFHIQSNNLEILLLVHARVVFYSHYYARK